MRSPCFLWDSESDSNTRIIKFRSPDSDCNSGLIVWHNGCVLEDYFREITIVYKQSFSCKCKLYKSQIDCNKITQKSMRQIGPGVGVFFKWETQLRLHTPELKRRYVFASQITLMKYDNDILLCVWCRSSEARAKARVNNANNVDYIRPSPVAESGDESSSRDVKHQTQDDGMINTQATEQRRQKPTAKRRLASFRYI